MKSIVRKIPSYFEWLVNYNFDIFLIYIILNFYVLFKINAQNLKSLDYILAHPYSFLLIIANTLLVSSIYLLNKLSDQEEDTENNTAVIFSNKIFYYYIIGSSIAFLIYSFISKDLLPFFSIFFFAGLLYSYPKAFKLKRLFILKNLIPSFCWYLSICILIYFNLKDYLNFYQILIQQIPMLCMFFMFEIIWDLPDLQGDKKVGVQTFPVILGFDLTKYMLILSNLIIFFFSVNVVYKVVSLVICMFLINAKENTSKRYYHFLVLAIALFYALFSAYLITSAKNSNGIMEKYYNYIQEHRNSFGLDVLSKEETKKLKACGNDGECFKKHFEKSTVKDGADLSFLKLFGFIKDYPEYNMVCHLGAHGIGHGALVRNKMNFNKAITEFDGTKYFGYGAICGSGYYHGLVEYLGHGLKTQQQIEAKFATLCDEPKNVRILDQACAHGIGHAAYLQLDYDLEKSLQVCEKLKIDDINRYQCYTGIFMEATQDLPEDMVLSIKDGKVNFHICENLQDPAQLNACYFGTSYLIPMVLPLVNKEHDFISAMPYCQQIEGEANRVTCIRRLTRDAVGQRYKKIKELCIDGTVTANERIMCVVNVANLTAIAITKTKEENYYKIVDDICTYLDGEEMLKCREYLRPGVLKDYLTTGADLNI